MEPIPASSVIICTRNRIQDLLLCLESLIKQTQTPREIIIVDSSDTPIDTNKKYISVCDNDAFANSRIIYKHTAQGLTKQRNIGISLATGNLIYFFDDDVIVENSYLEVMNSFFAQNPNYLGGMGSITNMPKKDMNVYRLLRWFFLLPRDYASGKFNASGLPTHSYGNNTFQKVEALGGCCMAYRSHVFEKHKFDEKLSTYGYMEDCDFSYRVSRDGPLFYHPEARLKHMQSPIARDAIVENKAMFIRNYRYLFFKNIYPKNRFKAIFFYWSVIGLFLEALILKNYDHIRGYNNGLRTPIR